MKTSKLASAAVTALLAATTLATPAWALGPGIQGPSGGGSDSDTGQTTDHATYVCRDGQLFREGVPFTYGFWPGCSTASGEPAIWGQLPADKLKLATVMNSLQSEAIRECTVGYLVFRFYGSVAAPASAYTVTRANIPGDQGCATSGDNEDGGTSVPLGRFFMMYTSPMDATGVPVEPWMRKDVSESADMADADFSSAQSQIWKVVNPPQENALATSGRILDSKGNCLDYSKPAIHQVGSFDPESAFGTVVVDPATPSQGRVSYSGNAGYLDAMNATIARYVRGSGGSTTVGSSLITRFLGLPAGAGAELTAQNTPAQGGYVACGSPLNYQVQLDDVKARDKDGRPTVVGIPPKGDVAVNGVAYIPITRMGYLFRYKYQNSFGFRADGAGVYAAERLSTTGARKSTSCTGLYDDKAGITGACDSTTLNQLYPVSSGKRTTSQGVRDKYRYAIRTWLEDHSDITGVPRYQQPVTGAASQPIDAQEQSYWAKVFVNTQSYSLLNPPKCLGDACGKTPVPVDPGPKPVCTSAACEAAPSIPTPTNGPDPTPTAGKFVWKVTAEGQKYLEVRSSAASNTAPLDFYATPLSEWKGDVAAEAFLDQQWQPRLDSDYQAALTNRANASRQVTGNGPSGLAAFENTSEHAANLGGKNWIMKMAWTGMAMNTWLPQCNTGEDTGCPAKATGPTQEPQVNSACSTVGCYTDGQVKRVDVLPASGSKVATGYQVGKKEALGQWNYRFFAATGKDKVVRVSRDASQVLDIDVRYVPTGSIDWFVGYRYKTWVAHHATRYVDSTCTVWEPTGAVFPPGDPNAGLAVTAPVSKPCKVPQDYVDYYYPSDWQYSSAGGSAQEYALPDADSEVAAPGGQPLTGEAGGAACQVPAPAGWNYCSPVLGNKTDPTS